MISKGFNGKISNIAELAQASHRTSITRFLSNSSWDEKLLKRSLKSYIIEFICSRSRETKHIYTLLLSDCKTIQVKMHYYSIKINVEII